MELSRKLYRNEQWFEFAARVRRRDSERCLLCGRSEPEVVLQVHHARYIEEKPPWEYALSDCRTLCRGCHAREHSRIEPSCGWSLLMIEDLGSAELVCERRGCGHEIRYAHLTYHAGWGYKVVGSSCVRHLTRADRMLSANVVTVYKAISNFVHESAWQPGLTKQGRPFMVASYKHHQIRIYGEEGRHSFQLVLKQRGVKWHEFRDIIPARDKSLDEVKELAYVALKGTLAGDEAERDLLREVYRRIR